MKAIVQDRYGSADVLRLVDVDKPAVGDDEVLVRVRAASIHADVWHVIRGIPFVLRFMGSGIFKPKYRIPGIDMAGQVVAVGKSVKSFQEGDEVFGETHHGMQWVNGGAFAEYVSIPEDILVLKPSNITFEQAAAVPTSAMIVLQNLRHRAQPQPGQKVLVNGAAGGVGSFCVQIVKAWGATVTAVDSTEKLDMLRSIGADSVIDYTLVDFTKSNVGYDLIVDIPGNQTFAACRRILVHQGVYVLIGHDHYGKVGRRFFGSIPYFMRLMLMSFFVDQLPKPDFSEPPKKEMMTVLKELIEEGKIVPYIDRTYPLNEVPEALRYIQEGKVKGKVVITVGKET